MNSAFLEILTGLNGSMYIAGDVSYQLDRFNGFRLNTSVVMVLQPCMLRKSHPVVDIQQTGFILNTRYIDYHFTISRERVHVDVSSGT